MAYDKVVDSAKLDAAMTATANAIRAKGGSTGKVAWDASSGFAGAVGGLPDAVPDVEQATPSISVSSAGLITASATQSAGKVAAGTKSATKQLTTQGAKTVTPTASEQVAVPAGVFTTGAVKVAGVSYDERAELRAQMLGIQASDLYALYSTSAKVGSATLKAHVESWLADSVYNNPTAYPNSAYEQAVNSAFEALDAYAAAAGTDTVVQGSMSLSSNNTHTISGLSFNKIKTVYIGAKQASPGNNYRLGCLLHDGDGLAISYYNGGWWYLLNSDDRSSFTYSGGTLTINTQTMAGSILCYTIIGE